ncbi:YggT family protein [Lacticaseibacillus pabuli]|uniref:YggT family protein n=1 Tax=Lacticaseibacillus pabuli TaxID=3025672 RepID=A0ABY7WRM7_9LACO|nr:YggT family protein [Lacticaseibacillus sp. KACC 23028]WDF81667.1 YggT family protein [Lacticaseibacillus sp. KACC 23028]
MANEIITILYYLVIWAFRIYTAIVFVDIILSWLPLPQLARLKEFTVRMTEPLYRPIRRLIPAAFGIDFSPAILLVLLGLVEQIIMRILLRLATML